MGAFTPGEFWTPERAKYAVDRMTKAMASPEVQTFMAEFAAATAAGGDSGAPAAEMLSGKGAAGSSAGAPIDRAACTYRRGQPSDVPEIARLIVAGEMAPLFIEEFVEGFVVLEHAGEVVGCGGLEIYDDTAVVRSVVVDQRARGQRLGVRIVELIIEEARKANVRAIYLFTGHADEFWRRLGFVDAPLETWNESARVYRPYQFIAQDPKLAAQVRSMWRTLT